MKLKDKVAIVSGATSGIGRAVALAYAKEGAKLALTGRNAERLARSEKECKAAGNGEVIAIQADLTKVSDMDKVVKSALDKYGRIDILYNSAGIAEFTPFLDVSEEMYDSVMATNLKSQFFMSQKVAQVMKKQNKGKIICMASVGGGTKGFPTLVAYTGSKAGVVGIVKAIALELAPFHINVNAISPGNVDSPMNEHLMSDPAYKEAMINMTPLRRNGQTSDITPAAIYLACEDSDYMTGWQLLIDGGMSA